MMVVQIHHPCWEIHIVVIPCHLAKSLQATTSSFIFILMLKSLELDSNWNMMQQVRSHTKYYVSRTRKRTRKFLLSYKCQLIFIGMKIFFSFFEKTNSKLLTQKNLIFQLRQFSIFFHQNFMY